MNKSYYFICFDAKIICLCHEGHGIRVKVTTSTRSNVLMFE